MSVTMISEGVRSQTDNAALLRFKSYVIFTICACLYILPFMRIIIVGTDEGTLDYGAVRVAHGQVFARDFFEVIGPGTFYWLAAFFKLLGVSFFATRVCLFITSIGTALLMYFLSRRACEKYQALPYIVLVGTSFGGLWPAISHHGDSNFFALMAIACLAVWQDKGKRVLLAVGGALAGATTCFLQPKGVLLFCAFLAFVFIQSRPRPGRLGSLGLLAGGYLGVIVTVLFYFWSKGALGDLIYVNMVWPFRHYGTVNAVPYGHGIILNYWSHWVAAKDRFLWTVPMAVVLFVPVLFVASLPGFLPLVGARFRWDIRKPQIQLLWLSGAALWASELHRMDMTHLVFGSPVLIILAVRFLSEYRTRITGYALQVLLICAVCLAAFNFCILVVARPVATRVGSIRLFKNPPVLSFLMTHVAPGEEIFAYPYSPSLYFFTSATNPTRFSIMAYNYNTNDQFQEVVRILDQHKVRYVVWDAGFQEVESMVFLDALPPDGKFIIEPYLSSHYKVVQEVDGIRIMERLSYGSTY